MFMYVVVYVPFTSKSTEGSMAGQNASVSIVVGEEGAARGARPAVARAAEVCASAPRVTELLAQPAYCSWRKAAAQ